MCVRYLGHLNIRGCRLFCGDYPVTKYLLVIQCKVTSKASYLYISLVLLSLRLRWRFIYLISNLWPRLFPVNNLFLWLIHYLVGYDDYQLSLNSISKILKCPMAEVADWTILILYLHVKCTITSFISYCCTRTWETEIVTLDNENSGCIYVGTLKPEFLVST